MQSRWSSRLLTCVAENVTTASLAQATFAAGDRVAEVEVEVPTELRNRMERMDVEGERGAGVVVLFDERWRRRPVGLVSGAAIEADQPLLSELFYLERALNPLSEVRKGEVRELLSRPLAMLVLADIAKIVDTERRLIEDWVANGGVLLRFAGPRLAEGVDDLVPVRLRSGGRELGGALSWSAPARLAPFDDATPFAGLEVPPDVHVRRQVLAEPSLDLADKTWVRLADSPSGFGRTPTIDKVSIALNRSFILDESTSSLAASWFAVQLLSSSSRSRINVSRLFSIPDLSLME